MNQRKQVAWLKQRKQGADEKRSTRSRWSGKKTRSRRKALNSDFTVYNIHSLFVSWRCWWSWWRYGCGRYIESWIEVEVLLGWRDSKNTKALYSTWEIPVAIVLLATLFLFYYIFFPPLSCQANIMLNSTILLMISWCLFNFIQHWPYASVKHHPPPPPPPAPYGPCCNTKKASDTLATQLKTSLYLWLRGGQTKKEHKNILYRSVEL